MDKELSELESLRRENARLEREVMVAISALDRVLHAIADAAGFRGERDGDAEMLVEHVRQLRARYLAGEYEAGAE